MLLVLFSFLNWFRLQQSIDDIAVVDVFQQRGRLECIEEHARLPDRMRSYADPLRG